MFQKKGVIFLFKINNEMSLHVIEIHDEANHEFCINTKHVMKF